jgi:hypothetical protein
MTRAPGKPATTMVSIYDGTQCRGWVLQRHWVNGLAVAYEAFNASERSLGIFGTQAAAVSEVWHRAHEEATP